MVNAPRSDLSVRTGSAIIMIVIVGLALWFGGLAFRLLVLAGAALLVWEWKGLTDRFPDDRMTRLTWLAFGFCYVALAALAILHLHSRGLFIVVLAAVIATDIGAYFTGRTFGGPKIAPSISPSKTWSGLVGGMTAAALVLLGAYTFLASTLIGNPEVSSTDPWFDIEIAALVALTGAGIAIVAQAGDFFESWAKRRAGVKDSGTLIPGHGGLFDRVDGLLLACLVAGGLFWAGRAIL
jgi:phosphatidate cytidylyltransferase